MGSGSGAGMGSMAGGIAGTAFGGPVGGMVGAQIGGMIGGALDQQQVDTSGFKPSPEEMAFMQRLNAQSQGKGGPSVAEAQLQQGLGQANAGAAGFAASQRGVSPGLAARLGMQVQGQNSMMANNQAALVRAQEQNQTNNLLASMYSSQRQSAGQAAQMQYEAEAAQRQQNAALVKGLGDAGMAWAGQGGFGGGGGTTTPPASGGGGNYLGANTTLTPKFYEGGKVPGKAEVPGNSPQNDKVDAKLSPGEIVIPRTHSEDPDKAKAFIDQLLSKKKDHDEKSGKGQKMEFKDLLKAQRETLERIKALESKLAGKDDDDDEDEED